jgi:xanthine dehydrogenase accessory factor
MREVLAAMMPGWLQGGTAGLATVVRTFRSAPRPPGASMLVTATGEVFGSVSGGCVEGAVYELATQVKADQRPVLVSYGISDVVAFSVGLSCGGTIEVFVEPISQQAFAELDRVREDIESSRPVGVATVIEHPDPGWLGRHLVVRPDGFEGELGSDRADHAVGDDTQGLPAAGRNSVLTYGPDG